MKISRLLNEATMMLKQAQIEDPAFEAGLILSWAVNKPRAFIYAHPEMELDPPEIRRFMELVERRSRGEPFQYITGECEFMSLRFKVNPGVLVPRSDTELLAEAALFSLGCDQPFIDPSLYRVSNQGIRRVLDIGTGSGCLAVSVARYAPYVTVDALDISEEALETARQNAELNSVSGAIRFIRADFLNDSGFTGCKYDLIISNPPYIPRDDKTGLMPAVEKYEPSQALFADDGGLIFYKRLARLSPEILAENGVILVECGFNQSAGVRDIFQGHGMETMSLKDLSGTERVIAARMRV
ncbi:MAG TPA: peptide chain release factor N(5)-glutamine methyltransferase [Thermoclostridium sp.]|jgi:release factor glutamine methyltransferase|nr:peptide chain release factor N(5)-glutamine methyltransferase [Clostridiaceae bacterium]HOQ75565.1 peptide chain release factor N(5)-glutamine methyltransferase [Thermoclostridium sp.]HPU45875.1 peptide chain release factor N(5)-glutamine methyltransferase [Thermoclostridium sp.]